MNKYLKKTIIIGAVSLFLVTGCGNKEIAKLSNGDEVVVELKDNTKISVNDLYNSLKNRYGLEVVVNMIDKIILEKEYPNDLNAAKESAETTMKQLEEQYGDKLESAIQYYTSYNTKEEYQDGLYLNYLQEKAVTSYAKAQIKESEIKKYYKDSIKPDIKISHILFSVNYDSNASDDDKNKAKEDAKNKANEVLEKLKSVSKDELQAKFSELAKEYSNDESTKNDGGNLGVINTDTLGSNYTKVVDAAYKLKDNEYTTEVVESELGYHIILRTETKEKASLDDVRDTVLDTLSNTYVSSHSEASIKAMQELRKKYNLNITDSELKTSYTNYIQNSLLQAQESDSSSSK